MGCRLGKVKEAILRFALQITRGINHLVHGDDRSNQRIYKRVERKLKFYRRLKKDKRSYLEIEKEAHILSDLERKIFFEEQHSRQKLINEVIDELKSEGKW